MEPEREGPASARGWPIHVMAVRKLGLEKNMIWAAAWLLVGAMPEPATPTRADEVFAELKALAGDWTGKDETGRPLQINYRLSANASVLVETWTLAPGRESLTLYHRDGATLMATHYCPLGNQPRLVLVSGASPSRFDFRFTGATNLSSPGAARQDSFWIERRGNELIRAESYVESGKAETQTAVFHRASTRRH
jgi:hypothetical protein